MDNRQRYCKYCGSEITGNFCPKCGAAIDGVHEPIAASAPPEGVPAYWEQNQGPKEHNGLRIFLSLLLLIIGAGMISIAFTFVTNPTESLQMPIVSSVADFLKSSLGCNDGKLYDIIVILGYITFIPGGIAVFGSICGLVKKGYTVGLTAYVLLTIFTLPTVIGLILGIILSVLWTKTESCY